MSLRELRPGGEMGKDHEIRHEHRAVGGQMAVVGGYQIVHIPSRNRGPTSVRVAQAADDRNIGKLRRASVFVREKVVTLDNRGIKSDPDLLITDPPIVLRDDQWQ